MGALFAAYFEQGRNVGDAAVLADVAATEAGLDRTTVTAWLASDALRDAVVAATRAAKAAQINGVPYYRFSDSYVLIGGQSVQVFTQVLRALARQARKAASAKL